MEREYAVDGMVGKVNISRIPKGIGVEIKAVADASSNIILSLV